MPLNLSYIGPAISAQGEVLDDFVYVKLSDIVEAENRFALLEAAQQTVAGDGAMPSNDDDGLPDDALVDWWEGE